MSHNPGKLTWLFAALLEASLDSPLAATHAPWAPLTRFSVTLWAVKVRGGICLLSILKRALVLPAWTDYRCAHILISFRRSVVHRASRWLCSPCCQLLIRKLPFVGRLAAAFSLECRSSHLCRFALLSARLTILAAHLYQNASKGLSQPFRWSTDY